MMIFKADKLLKELQTLIDDRQAARYKSGIAPSKRYPVMFKELPLRQEKTAEILEVAKYLNQHDYLYFQRLPRLLLFAAMILVRFRPRSGGFWDHFYQEINDWNYSKLFERMWQGFEDAKEKSWFKAPILRDGSRQLVQSIYREAKTIRFKDIERFFMSYYASYNSMRAFDVLYSQQNIESVETRREKEEHKAVVYDTIEKLIHIFNYLAEAELIEQRTDINSLIQEVARETSIDPLTFFNNAEDFKSLYKRVFFNTFTSYRFEKFLRNNRDKEITMFVETPIKLSCNQLLEKGIVFTEYQINQQRIQVIPKAGINPKQMISWPYDVFFDPGNPSQTGQELDSDMVGIKRHNPFFVNMEGQFYDSANALYSDNKLNGYLWIGTNRIGQILSTDHIKCLPRKGHHFHSGLKYDPQKRGIKILIAYLDFFDPVKIYADLEIKINAQDVIWSGKTDHNGKKITEIYESQLVKDDAKDDKLTVQLFCNGESIGEPHTLYFEPNLLFSEYSNAVLPPGKRKFGERRFVLFTRELQSSIKSSSSVHIQKSDGTFKDYNLYDLYWQDSSKPFHLFVNMTEWHFSELEELFIRSEFQYSDENFDVPPEIIPFATTNPSDICFYLQTNLNKKQIKLFDFSLSFDGRILIREPLDDVLKQAKKSSQGIFKINMPFLKQILAIETLKIGKYAIVVSRGHFSSREYYRQDVEFFVIPKLKISSELQIFKEGDDVSLYIESKYPCFLNENSNYPTKLLVKSLGKAHLQKDFSQYQTIFLTNPRLTLKFIYQPTIFACRVGGKEIGNEVYLHTFSDTPLIVYGLPNNPLTIKTDHYEKQFIIDQSGEIRIPYSFLKKIISSWKNRISIHHLELINEFDILWQTRILRLNYLNTTEDFETVQKDEVYFEIEIEGPSDSHVKVRLMNNLGQLCGEKIISETGVIKNSVLWTNNAAQTRTLVIKAFVRNAIGEYVDAGIDELHYEFISPKFELIKYQKQIEENPENAIAYYRAAILATENDLLKKEEIIRLLRHAIKLNLSDAFRLDRVSKELYKLGEVREACNTLRKVIRIQGASSESYTRCLDYMFKKSNWDNTDDEESRFILDFARSSGMDEGKCLYYFGCRALKAGRIDEALNCFWNDKIIQKDQINAMRAIAYFKQGFYTQILKDSHQSGNFSVPQIIYAWAKYVQDMNIPVSVDLDKQSPVPNFLSPAEVEILQIFAQLIMKDKEQDALKSFEKMEPCVPPGLVTQFILYKKSGNSAKSDRIYRQLVAISLYFENELKR